MKKFCGIIVLIFAFLFINCSLPPYSQDRIIKKTKKMLADSGEYYLGKWLVTDKRVSFDTLTKICSPNINQYDSIRSALFICLSEIMDTTILKLMGVKVVFGNPIEKLTASTYIYNYYGVKMTFDQDVPLASLLLLFHSTADNLSKSNYSQFYTSIEKRNEIAKTFPKTQNLYREFILNENLSTNIRTWFVESLLCNNDREIVSTFLLGIEAELEEDSPIQEVVNQTIYTIINQGAKGDWIIID